MAAANEHSNKVTLHVDGDRRRFLAGPRPTKRLDDYLLRLKQKESKHSQDKHDK